MLKSLIIAVCFMLAPAAMGAEFLLVQQDGRGWGRPYMVKYDSPTWKRTGPRYEYNDPYQHQARDRQAIEYRTAALNGMPIFYSDWDLGVYNIYTFRGTYEAAQWFRDAGDTRVRIHSGPDWLENPLWTPGERKLHHILKSSPHIDTVRIVSRDKVVSPPDTRPEPEATTDPETGETVAPEPLPPYTPIEVTIRLWPEWVIYSEGDLARIDRVVINKQTNQIVFYSSNPTLLSGATILLKQGITTITGKPVASRIISTDVARIHADSKVTLSYSFLGTTNE